jgi:hypothetical protein
MTIQESLDLQALKLIQNPSERAKYCLHELKRLAMRLVIAETRKTQGRGL